MNDFADLYEVVKLAWSSTVRCQSAGWGEGQDVLRTCQPVTSEQRWAVGLPVKAIAWGRKLWKLKQLEFSFFNKCPQEPGMNDEFEGFGQNRKEDTSSPVGINRHSMVFKRLNQVRARFCCGCSLRFGTGLVLFARTLANIFGHRTFVKVWTEVPAMFEFQWSSIKQQSTESLALEFLSLFLVALEHCSCTLMVAPWLRRTWLLWRSSWDMQSVFSDSKGVLTNAEPSFQST